MTGPPSRCVLHERTDKAPLRGSGPGYLGTDRSPLALFSGLQRSVTTVLRPDGQDDVASRDLNSKFPEFKTEHEAIFFLLLLLLLSNLKESPVEEVDIWDFLGGLGVLLRYGLYSIKSIFHCNP